ncbi:hypothetical protein FRC06_009132, partial [Ceratobasidium sp. 370]
FRSLQHRKERKGFQHEFIVLRLVDGSICRIERMGDPNARLNAISAEGTTAYDMAQSFADDSSPNACLETSDVIAEIEFPRELDLMDVLRICRAIHEGEKTCNYTLQSYNCYFFTLAIQAVLTRLVAAWKEFTSDTWNLSLDEGLSALSRLYKEAPSGQAQWPFILRIYSLLGPEIQWPVNSLLPHLKRDLLDPELVLEVNRACTTALWHSDLELAVDHILCEKVRDTIGRILCDPEFRGTSRDLGASSAGNVELASAESQCSGLLSVLVSRAISRHKRERPTSKLNRLWGHMNIFQAFELFSSAAQSLRNLDFRRTKKPRLTERPFHSNSFSAQQISGWLLYTKSLAMWAFLVALGLFWIVPLDFMQRRRGVFVEEELEQTLITLGAPKQSGRTTDLMPMVKKLHSLVTVKEPVLWREWPWVHAYEPIRRRIAGLALNEEKHALRAAFQTSDTRLVSLSLFQKHLLNRIRLHAQRVESFKLGRATRIQDDLEDKISQVWVLVRNDDISIQPGENDRRRLDCSDLFGSPVTNKPSKATSVFKPFLAGVTQLQEWANYYGVELIYRTETKGATQWDCFPISTLVTYETIPSCWLVQGIRYPKYTGHGPDLRSAMNQAAEKIIRSGVLDSIISGLSLQARKQPGAAPVGDVVRGLSRKPAPAVGFRQQKVAPAPAPAPKAKTRAYPRFPALDRRAASSGNAGMQAGQARRNARMRDMSPPGSRRSPLAHD